MIPTPDERYTFMQGDVVEQLRLLPPESVHCVITSPPYYGLRDYQTARWEGGSAECDHQMPRNVGRSKPGDKQSTHPGSQPDTWQECGKCGARRIDQAIGLERTLPEYIERMVGVFREVRRVLRKDGTVWCNMGDSYAQSGGNSDVTEEWGASQKRARSKGYDVGGWGATTKRGQGAAGRATNTARDGFKPKDLMMVPARLAIALQEDGWYLRSEITWCKRAPMPESCTDRPTSATERIYLLSRSPKYFYDADAVREPAEFGRREWSNTGENLASVGLNGHRGHATVSGGDPSTGRNLWNYWLLAPESFAAAHFATFPTEIPRRAILAGTSERGCCPQCGAPWRRVTEPSTEYLQVLQRGRRDPSWKAERRSEALAMGNAFGDKPSGGVAAYQTKGWQPTCKCPHTDADVVPAVVLDPFAGAGTTIMVALRLGRRGIGIDLSQKYIDMAERRIQSDPEAMNARMLLDA